MAQRERLVWPVGQEVLQEGGAGFESPVVLPATSLLHHRARVLDPTTAPQPGSTRRNRDLNRLGRAEEPTVDYQPTVYVTNQVLVSVENGVDLVDPLVTAFNRRISPIRLVPDASDLRRAGDLAEQRAAQQDDERPGAAFPPVVRLRLVAEGDEVAEPPDAWRMVQRLRDALADEGFRRSLTEDQEDTTDPAELRRRDELRERVEQEGVQVGLNHLLFAAQVGGVGFSIGHSAGGVGFSIGHGFSVGHSTGPSEYAVPGLGGRAPVRWVGRPPARTEELTNRPMVAILDTGVAKHPWFDDAPAGPVVERLVYDSATRTVSAAVDGSGEETNANLIDPLEGVMDPYFGHGTFIAGLIHQVCPDAGICSIKMMGTDGVVTEEALLDGLAYLYRRQVEARRAGEPDQLIDVVSLSLGYYHESDLDAVSYDAKLKRALDALADEGVLVVAAAGNNATMRPMLPAAFCPHANGVLTEPAGRVPMVSVGALNPDNSVALFSNAGPWVACHSPGAALVSTLPLADQGQRSGVDLSTGAGPAVAGWRATIDPDHFTGFGSWSGTSFAAPVMAGSAAQALLDGAEASRVGGPADRARRALASLGFTIATE